MTIFNNITRILQHKVKTLLLLAVLMFLSACGDDCSTIQDYFNEGIGNNCFLCPLFDIISDAGSSAAQKSWSNFAKDLQGVVAIAAAIYVAIRTLKDIGSFTKKNAADFLTGDKKGLFSLLFKAAVIILLLNSSYLCDDIIVPILLAGLEIGSNLAISGTQVAGVSEATSSGFDGLFEAVNVNIRNFNDQLYLNVAIANAMSCLSTQSWLLEWHFLMLLYSLILFTFGWILLVGISFYLADLLIRLSIAAILLPLGIAMAVSDKTVGYTKNIWNVFINLFFSFIILGIILGLAANLVDLGLGRNGDLSASGNDVVDGAMNLFLTDLSATINENMVEKLATELQRNGSLILTVVCFSVLVKLSANLDSLVNRIAGGGGLPSPASAVGAAAIGIPANVAKRAAKRVGKWAQDGAVGAGKRAARFTRMDRLYHWGGRKASTVRGFLTGTGSRGYNSMFRRQTWRSIGTQVSGLGTDIRRGNVSGGLRRVWGWIKS